MRMMVWRWFDNRQCTSYQEGPRYVGFHCQMARQEIDDWLAFRLLWRCCGGALFWRGAGAPVGEWVKRQAPKLIRPEYQVGFWVSIYSDLRGLNFIFYSTIGNGDSRVECISIRYTRFLDTLLKSVKRHSLCAMFDMARKCRKMRSVSKYTRL